MKAPALPSSTDTAPEVMTMPRTREQLEKAAADAERWLDDLDPDDPTVHVDRVGDLREIGDALTRMAAAENRVTAAVWAAREHGRSWTDIARVLGVSRQAAQKRYDRDTAPAAAAPVPADPPPEAPQAPAEPERDTPVAVHGFDGALARTQAATRRAMQDIAREVRRAGRRGRTGRYVAGHPTRGGLSAGSGINMAGRAARSVPPRRTG